MSREEAEQAPTQGAWRGKRTLVALLSSSHCQSGGEDEQSLHRGGKARGNGEEKLARGATGEKPLRTEILQDSSQEAKSYCTVVCC
jgi:hypothetical protein